MKVKNDFYNANSYIRPDTVKKLVSWANAIMADKANRNKPEFNLAKSIKSIAIKNYKIDSCSSGTLCQKWEDEPYAMIRFILANKKGERIKISRIDKSLPFSPDNVLVKTLQG